MRSKRYESDYCVVYFDEKTCLYEQYWYKESEKMDVKDFKEMVVKTSAITKGMRLPLLNILIDNREFLFSIAPELQEWHANYVSPKLQKRIIDISLVKTAYVASNDFISQLSIEQTADENLNKLDTTTRYFETLEEARAWLLDE